MNPDPTSLDRLRDIVAPPAAPWWPPAPGWYVVLGGALVVLLALAFRGFIRWQQACYRREALARLAKLQETLPLRSPEARAAALRDMAVLLKRAALTAYPRPSIAPLTGPRWFAFLDQAADMRAFREGAGAQLEGVTYDPPSAATMQVAQIKGLIASSRHWITKHHKP